MSRLLERPSSVLQFLHQLGGPFFDQGRVASTVFFLVFKMLQIACKPRLWRGQEILQVIVVFGIESIPLIVLSTAIAGVIMTHEIAWHLNAALHTVEMIPGFIGQFIFRELGIAIPALLLVAKVGAATTAEIATLKITEQLDALRLLGIDPFVYLVFPRLVGSIVASFCLTVISIAVTTLCAVGVAVQSYQFSFAEFFQAVGHSIHALDVACAAVKGVSFGAMIPLISCAYGLRCQGGAEGVGKATTQAVVTATIWVITADFLLTYVFTQAY